MSGWIDRMDVCMDKQANGQINKWMIGWIDGQIPKSDNITGFLKNPFFDARVPTKH